MNITCTFKECIQSQFMMNKQKDGQLIHLKNTIKYKKFKNKLMSKTKLLLMLKLNSFINKESIKLN
jgi:hypothetical protein